MAVFARRPKKSDRDNEVSPYYRGDRKAGFHCIDFPSYCSKVVKPHCPVQTSNFSRTELNTFLQWFDPNDISSMVNSDVKLN